MNIEFVGLNGNIALKNITFNDYMSSSEKVICLAICFYEDGKIEGNPYMGISIEDLSSIVNSSKSTTSKIVRSMVEKGYIDCIRKGQGNPNIYIFKEWRKWQ